MLSIQSTPKTLIILWNDQIYREVCKRLFQKELKNLPSSTFTHFTQHFTELEEKVGKRHALYLLSTRALLTSQLKSKLLSKGISSEIAQKIILFCQTMGYIDDSASVERFIQKEQKKGRSALAITQKLKAKGMQCAIPTSSDEQALRALIQKMRKNRAETPEQRRKLAAKLCRRGFAPDLVMQCLNL